MKITGVETRLYRDTAGRGQTDASPATVHCLVEVRSDSGLTGVATAAPWARESIHSLVDDLLVGEDPRAAAALWQRVGKGLERHSRGAFQHLRAVLDLAVWDLKAKERNEPLWKTLGGARPRANACASWTDVDSDDQAVAEWFGYMAQEYGFRSGKITAGGNLQADVRRLGLMRKALLETATEPEIMFDAGGRWWPTEARRNIRKIESQFDLTFVQGATESLNFLAAKRLSDGIRAAVCIGRGLTQCSAFLPFFHHHAANVVEIDMLQLGITGALQIADTAYGFELPVTLTAAPGNVHVHLAAVLPNCMSVEVEDAGSGSEVYLSGVRFESGWGTAGDAIGNGLSLNREFLSRHSLDSGD